MKKIFLPLLLLCSILSFSNNYLSINNPQNWRNYNAVINEAEITVRPVGAFVEYALTLSIGGLQPINEPDEEQLEIVLHFDLPSNSIVIDSWLWIEGTPKQADLLDRWTASAIYESIVNRRKDPSLLVKNGKDQYKINIYPMKTKESRKFKIVYLSPAKYIGTQLSLDIPSNILNLSSTQLKELKTYILPNPFFQNSISKNNDVKISEITHAEHGTCSQAIVPNASFGSSQILMSSNNNESIKIAKYGDQNEGYYQLTFVPSDLISQDVSPKKICYLIDYDKNFTSQNIKTLISELSLDIQNNIGKNDKFNVIFSNLTPSPYFTDWVDATSENINNAFNSDKISQYSNLISLLATGIEYVNKDTEPSSIVLITNNCSFNNLDVANAILKDLTALNVNNKPIHVIDYTEGTYVYTWLANSYYFNNGYLFTNLSRKTTGEYISFVNSNDGTNFYSKLEDAIGIVGVGSLKNVDIYTGNETGFCYGRMNVSNSISNYFSYNKAIHHIGRYKGGFPSSLELAFELENHLYHQKVQLSNYTVNETDSVLQTIWSGLNIFDLEKQGNSSQIINEILDQSIENRILSYYTAFLCVEDNIEICENCGEFENLNPEDNVIVSVDEKGKAGLIKAYPNPFTSQVKFELPTEDNLVDLKIFNTMGQCVKTITADNNSNRYFWDGKDESGSSVKVGIYLVKAVYKNRVINLKIMKK